MTNGDKIRQMSDEEFSEFMKHNFCPYERCIDIEDKTNCHDCISDWLREEVTEHEKVV